MRGHAGEGTAWALSDDTVLPFSFPAIGRKKLTAAFDGRRLASDGGVLLGQIERRLRGAGKLARPITDRRPSG